MRKHTYIFIALLCLGMGIQSCVSTSKHSTIERNKHQHLDTLLWQAITHAAKSFDASLHVYGAYVKAHGGFNNKRKTRVDDNAYLNSKLGRVKGNLAQVQRALSADKDYQKYNNTNEFINAKDEEFSPQWLVKQLDEYAQALNSRLSPYLQDTTSWSKRYLKALPKAQRTHPPSFAEFYFKGTSREEAIAILSTLQLGILQEALEIQKRIFKE